MKPHGTAAAERCGMVSSSTALSLILQHLDYKRQQRQAIRHRKLESREEVTTALTQTERCNADFKWVLTLQLIMLRTDSLPELSAAASPSHCSLLCKALEYSLRKTDSTAQQAMPSFSLQPAAQATSGTATPASFLLTEKQQISAARSWIPAHEQRADKGLKASKCCTCTRYPAPPPAHISLQTRLIGVSGMQLQRSKG